MKGRHSILALLASLSLGACGGPDGGEQAANRAAIVEQARKAEAPLPPVLGNPDPTRPLVVIDPGHGGRDPGASSPFDELAEKEVTLAVARAVRDALVESGRVRVALTRDGDDHLSLPARYGVARRLGADLFVSLHADAAGREGAQGATIYTLSEVASDREAAALARRENGGDPAGTIQPAQGQEVRRILIDLAQREAMEASADFARLLHREASPLVPFQSEYHRFASLIVLKAPDMPSILFECGYLTNAADIAFLRSEEGRARIAEGMRKAIETHFARQSLGRAAI